MTVDIICHSKFLQCHTDHFKSLKAEDCIDQENNLWNVAEAEAATGHL